MEKKFKCKDEVIYRDKNIEEYEWTYGIFSHSYKDDGREWYVINGEHLSLKQWDILPYKGNEHLVGSTDSPNEEVKLEEGEICIFSDAINEFLGFGIISRLVEKKRGLLYDEVGRDWNYAIRYKDFDPFNMEETKKHILYVKNGRIIRYKG